MANIKQSVQLIVALKNKEEICQKGEKKVSIYIHIYLSVLIQF